MKIYSAPFSICFAITNKCNLRCKHCVAKESWSNEDLTTEEMLDLIDQIGSAKVFGVAIFGGEPLLREDLFVLIEHLRKYPMNLSMNTNAMLIDENIAKTLVKNYNITSYVVSLDGNREVHEKIRGKNSFDSVLRGIENLVKVGASVLLSVTVNKLNIPVLEEIAEIGRRLKVKNVRYNHTFYAGNAKCYLNDIYISPSEEKIVCEKVYELSKKYKNFIMGSYLQQYEKFQQMKNVKPAEDKVKVYPCGAATTKCVIRADGWVTPCDILWEVRAGNVREEKFINIWQNSPIMKNFREPLLINFKKFDKCRGCEYQFVCFTGHRCYPYYYPGGIENKKLYCYKEN